MSLNNWFLQHFVILLCMRFKDLSSLHCFYLLSTCLLAVTRSDFITFRKIFNVIISSTGERKGFGQVSGQVDKFTCGGHMTHCVTQCEVSAFVLRSVSGGFKPPQIRDKTGQFFQWHVCHHAQIFKRTVTRKSSTSVLYRFHFLHIMGRFCGQYSWWVRTSLSTKLLIGAAFRWNSFIEFQFLRCALYVMCINIFQPSFLNLWPIIQGLRVLA